MKANGPALADLGDQLIGGDDGVAAVGAQGVGVVEGLVAGVQAGFGGPFAVGVDLVHGVGGEGGPALVGVGGQEHGAGVAPRVGAGIGLAQGDHLVAVEVEDLRRGGLEAVGDAGGAPGRRLAGAAEGDGWSARRRRGGRDPHGAPPVLEGLAGPGLLEHGDGLGGAPGPFVHGRAEHLELGAHVPVGEGEVEAAVAQQVDDGDVLGQSQRVVERRDHGRHADAQVRRARRHRRSYGQRAGEVPVG